VQIAGLLLVVWRFASWVSDDTLLFTGERERERESEREREREREREILQHVFSYHGRSGLTIECVLLLHVL